MAAVAWLLALAAGAPPEVATSTAAAYARAVEGAPPYVACALETADALARRGVQYRAFGLLTRAELDREPVSLSCSELTYYVYARCGVALGDEHARTRWLAYADPAPYADGMRRLPPDAPPRTGDLLVYHRPRDVVEAEVARRGLARPGHVVLLVDLATRLVIGAHGRESTPEPHPTGVGYRTLPDLASWDAGRTLQAIFRPTGTSTVALPPLDPPEPADDEQ